MAPKPNLSSYENYQLTVDEYSNAKESLKFKNCNDMQNSISTEISVTDEADQNLRKLVNIKQKLDKDFLQNLIANLLEQYLMTKKHNQLLFSSIQGSNSGDIILKIVTSSKDNETITIEMSQDEFNNNVKKTIAGQRILDTIAKVPNQKTENQERILKRVLSYYNNYPLNRDDKISISADFDSLKNKYYKKYKATSVFDFNGNKKKFRNSKKIKQLISGAENNDDLISIYEDALTGKSQFKGYKVKYKFRLFGFLEFGKASALHQTIAQKHLDLTLEKLNSKNEKVSYLRKTLNGNNKLYKLDKQSQAYHWAINRLKDLTILEANVSPNATPSTTPRRSASLDGAEHENNELSNKKRASILKQATRSVGKITKSYDSIENLLNQSYQDLDEIITELQNAVAKGPENNAHQYSQDIEEILLSLNPACKKIISDLHKKMHDKDINCPMIVERDKFAYIDSAISVIKEQFHKQLKTIEENVRKRLNESDSTEPLKKIKAFSKRINSAPQFSSLHQAKVKAINNKNSIINANNILTVANRQNQNLRINQLNYLVDTENTVIDKFSAITNENKGLNSAKILAPEDTKRLYEHVTAYQNQDISKLRANFIEFDTDKNQKTLSLYRNIIDNEIKHYKQDTRSPHTEELNTWINLLDHMHKQTHTTGKLQFIDPEKESFNSNSMLTMLLDHKIYQSKYKQTQASELNSIELTEIEKITNDLVNWGHPAFKYLLTMLNQLKEEIISPYLNALNNYKTSKNWSNLSEKFANYKQRFDSLDLSDFDEEFTKNFNAKINECQKQMDDLHLFTPEGDEYKNHSEHIKKLTQYAEMLEDFIFKDAVIESEQDRVIKPSLWQLNQQYQEAIKNKAPSEKVAYIKNKSFYVMCGTEKTQICSLEKCVKAYLSQLVNQESTEKYLSSNNKKQRRRNLKSSVNIKSSIFDPKAMSLDNRNSVEAHALMLIKLTKIDDTKDNSTFTADLEKSYKLKMIFHIQRDIRQCNKENSIGFLELINYRYQQIFNETERLLNNPSECDFYNKTFKRFCLLFAMAPDQDMQPQGKVRELFMRYLNLTNGNGLTAKDFDITYHPRVARNANEKVQKVLTSACYTESSQDIASNYKHYNTLYTSY